MIAENYYDISAFFMIMDAYQLSEGTIVINTHEEEVSYGNKTVHILPAWKWLKYIRMSQTNDYIYFRLITHQHVIDV